MKRLLPFLGALALALLTSSCETTNLSGARTVKESSLKKPTPKPTVKKTAAAKPKPKSSSSSSSTGWDKAHAAFKSRSDYPKTSNVYRNSSLYSTAKAGNTTIRIDLGDQRAQLLVGSGRKVAIDTPVSTGKSGKRTPTGTFPILQKLKDKRSTIFGKCYKSGKQVHKGDKRKCPCSYDKFVGASLPYWMRMNNSGIGLHGSSYVHRYAGSNGCIRVPHAVVDDLFWKVGVGTKVVVVW